MAKVVFGDHSSVPVPRQDRGNIRRFHCGAFGGEATRAGAERDVVRPGDGFHNAKCPIRIWTSRRREASACGWSAPTKTLAFYEGTGEGPNVAKVKEARGRMPS